MDLDSGTKIWSITHAGKVLSKKKFKNLKSSFSTVSHLISASQSNPNGTNLYHWGEQIAKGWWVGLGWWGGTSNGGRSVGRLGQLFEVTCMTMQWCGASQSFEGKRGSSGSSRLMGEGWCLPPSSSSFLLSRRRGESCPRKSKFVQLDNNAWSNYPIALSALLKKNKNKNNQLFGISCLLHMQ